MIPCAEYKLLGTLLKIALTSACLVLGAGAALAAIGNGSWSLRTDDTEIRLGIVNERPCLLSLRSSGDKHNWVAPPTLLSLMEEVWVGGKPFPVAWRVEEIQVSSQTGQLTFSLTNADLALSLRSIWRALPGHGPVEHRMEIANRSSRQITLSHQDSPVFQSLRLSGPAIAHCIKRGGSNADTQGGTFHSKITWGQFRTITSRSCRAIPASESGRSI